MHRPFAESSGQRNEGLVLGVLAAAFYLLLCWTSFADIRHLNQGHFTYALDDPYIHLALSEGIAHGHYGINPGEPASPSSSFLWPFMLAPFARYAWQVYVPLLLNLVAGIGIALLAGAAVARWPAPVEGDSGPRTERFRRLVSALALVFIGNLVGLTFIGMEHTLQVLLAGAGAWAIIACLRGRAIPWWCLVCVALGPIVRYENLAISIAVAIALLGQRRMRSAAGLLVVSVVPLLVFSVYLHHIGLPWLPTSVLVKGRMAAAANGHGMVSRTAQFLGDGFEDAPTGRHRMLVAVLFLTLAGLAWNERNRERRFALTGAAAAAGLHLLVGRFHWFHRYEVYIVFFSALVVLHVVHERARGVLGWYVLGLLGCSFLYIEAFQDVPRSASEVYRQQFQMHRFETDFYKGNVAVNDLGLVSYRRPPGTYVLDLWGLGSIEAARQKDKSTAWLDATVRQHNVGLVMDYRGWFKPAPPDWTFLGELCLPETPVALGGTCVAYYAVNGPEEDDVQDEFDRFVTTLPPGVVVMRRP